MIFVNMHEAKTQLSKYIGMIADKQETVIVCKNGKPVAQLTEYKSEKKLKLGLLKDQIIMAENFDDPLPDDIMRYFQ